MIGNFGPIVFTASANLMRTFTGLTKESEARYAEHALAGQKPQLEFIGPGLESITFSIRLDRFLGINPEDEIQRAEELRDEGEVQPLIIGGKYIGMYVITSAREGLRHHDNRGRLVVADLDITLKEYPDGGN